MSPTIKNFKALFHEGLFLYKKTGIFQFQSSH